MAGGAPLGPGRDFQARLSYDPPPATPPVQARSGKFLVRRRKAAYAIVLALDSSPAEWTGAEELRDHIREISGAELPIALEPYSDYPRAVAVGFNVGLPAPLREEAFGRLDAEELVIKPHGDTLLLAGGSPRATLYAVYEFLHRLGVRWYSPDFTVIPRQQDIPLPSETLCYAPPVTGRTFAAGIRQDPAWMARNRVTSFAHWGPIGGRYGGARAEGPDMHTVWRLVPTSVLDEHPEWAAEVDGQRTQPVNLNTWDLCYSNEEARSYFVGRTVEWAREHPDIGTVWIGQNDSPMHCGCGDCQAFYDAHGGGALVGHRAARQRTRRRPCRERDGRPNREDAGLRLERRPPGGNGASR